ncbi:MAG: EAL domain-containing protein [Pseudomonadota bacterium]|nr:EAL domain-containing protein [Pseudomonadota bacterium]
MAYAQLALALASSASLAAASLLLPENRYDSAVLALAIFTMSMLCFLIAFSGKLDALRARLGRSEAKEQQLQALLDHSPAALILLNKHFRPIYTNQKFHSLSGISDDSVPDTADIERLLSLISEETRQRIRSTIEQGRSWEGELHIQLADREEYVAAVASATKDEQGNIEHYIFSCEDISENKAIANRLFVREHYSVLTGLPNRQLALKNLQHTIEQQGEDASGFAILHLDLDRIRFINDSLGHHVVDRLFRETAERLRRCINDEQLLAHLGADEFLIILGEGSCSDEASIFAETVLSKVSERYLIDTNEINVSASIGISQYPDHGRDAETLLRRAEAAMFAAKGKGGNQFSFYQAGMSSQAEYRLETESQLRRAIERDEFKLHFQPVIELGSNRLVAAEVLLRWHNNELRNPGPDQFISVAEECGMIGMIGEWVMINACQQAMRWRRAGLPEINIAVNISARQFEESEIVDTVRRALQQSGLPARQLELEITEGLLINDTPNLRQCFQELKALGVRLSLDDFGTGYASLSYLKRYPFDILKIDRSFVHDIDQSQDSVTLVNAIIAMAHSFGMSVIAEGVENLQQRRLLKDHHCDMVQGFLYTPALNAEAFSDWAKRYADVHEAQHI